MFSQTISETNVSSGANVSESDTRLITRSRAGDMAAFEQIYRNYERPVFRHALYLLGSREDADDVKQETFLRAYRMLASFRHDCDLQTWLYKICSNLCYDLLRRKQRRPQISLDSESVASYLAEEDERNNPVLLAERAQTLDALLKILQGMPMPQRHVITLYLLEGFDYARIAEILGCARGSAKMRVLRSMEQYRERIASFLQEPAGGNVQGKVDGKVGGKDHV
jgi:RNA polymerase sigma-70 factor, ECF subfamily